MTHPYLDSLREPPPDPQTWTLTGTGSPLVTMRPIMWQTEILSQPRPPIEDYPASWAWLHGGQP